MRRWFILPGGRATGWTSRFQLLGNAEFSGSLSCLHVSFYSHFSAHVRKSDSVLDGLKGSSSRAGLAWQRGLQILFVPIGTLLA
jgi:hypothetical protein